MQSCALGNTCRVENPTDDVGRQKPLAAGGGGAVALHGQGSHSKKTQCSPAQALVGLAQATGL